jgi:uncharacterized membrane protein
MAEDDERGASVSLGRTLALSDGIFAIAMTLLAFQIMVPNLSGNQVQQLAHKLAQQGDSYLVFGLSFLVIGLLWLAHHRLFVRVQRADEAVMSLNLLFLMTVAALPFPSGVLGRYGSQPVAVVLYASFMASAGYLLTAISLVARHRGLLTPDTTPEGIRQGLRRSVSMAGVFTLSIPFAFVIPSVTPYIWFLVVPAARLSAGRTRRGRGDSAAGA